MRHVLSTLSRLAACVALPALPALVGCSAPLSGSADAVDADANATSAVVVIERSVTITGTGSDGKGDARGSAVARFVRMRSGAVDDDALRLVGAAVDFPALGTCGSTGQPAQRSAAARAVELLDVGALSLEAGGQRTNLQARQIPDVVDLLSGVVYATQTADADALPPHSDYLLQAAGSVGGDLEVAPFAVRASAPDEPQALRVAGRDVTADGSVAALAADEGVELAWAAGSPDDLVYVDIAGDVPVAAGDAPSPSATRCLFSDAGKATLSPSAFGQASSGTITIHRLHSEPFRVKGVDTGEVRFDFAIVIPFNRS